MLGLRSSCVGRTGLGARATRRDRGLTRAGKRSAAPDLVKWVFTAPALDVVWVRRLGHCGVDERPRRGDPPRAGLRSPGGGGWRPGGPRKRMKCGLVRVHACWRPAVRRSRLRRERRCGPVRGSGHGRHRAAIADSDAHIRAAEVGSVLVFAFDTTHGEVPVGRTVGGLPRAARRPGGTTAGPFSWGPAVAWTVRRGRPRGRRADC